MVEVHRKRFTVVTFAVGWVVVAASTAGAVVVLGKSDTKSHATAVAAPSTPHASASGSPTPSQSPSTTASASTPTSTVSTPPPKPVSTVTGSVNSNLVHSGDLRFFLLPVPSDGSALGDADGKMLTKDDVAAEYSNSSTVLQDLAQLGFKDGAYREYQTGDAAYHVEAKLLRFGSEQSAQAWFEADIADSKWTTVPITGYSSAKGWAIAPASTGDLAHMRGLYYRGDTVFEIYVTGQDPLDHGVLVDRMRRQIDRLTTGV